MKKITIIFLIVGLVFFTFGFKRKKSDATRLPLVVSTFCFIDDFVRYIGAEHIEAKLLIPANLDPHSYEPGKGDADQIMNADAILYHGLNLENNSNLLRMIGEHKNSVAIGKKIYSSSPNKFIVSAGCACCGDSKNEVDPHFWLDVQLWSEIVDPIVEILSTLDKKHRDCFIARGAELKEKLKTLDNKINKTMHAIPSKSRYLVTTHSSFQYFVKRYVCDPHEGPTSRSISPEGLSPEVQVSLFDLSRVRDFVQEHGVRTLFREYSIPSNSLSRLKDFKYSSGPINLSKDVLYSDSFNAAENDQVCYIAMMEHNADVIFNELKQDALPVD